MAAARANPSDATAYPERGTAVRKAVPTEAPEVGVVLAGAFFHDPVFRWIVPDDDRRSAMLPAFFSLFAGLFQPYDEVYATDEVSGAALWAPPGTQPLDDDPDEFARRIEDMAGMDAERMFEVAKLIDAHHPQEPHHYLQFMGVSPERQGRGLGSALMAPVLERCDQEGEPAYLEATSERNRKLYERHGFEPTGEFAPAGGPPLVPMWRSPGSAR